MLSLSSEYAQYTPEFGTNQQVASSASSMSSVVLQTRLVHSSPPPTCPSTSAAAPLKKHKQSNSSVSDALPVPRPSKRQRRSLNPDDAPYKSKVARSSRDPESSRSSSRMSSPPEPIYRSRRSRSQSKMASDDGPAVQRDWSCHEEIDPEDKQVSAEDVVRRLMKRYKGCKWLFWQKSTVLTFL